MFTLGALASVGASLGTALGALPVLAFRKVSPRAQDVLQSVAAGIMLAATVFSLVLPGIAAAQARLGAALPATLVVTGAMLLGSLAVHLVHRHAPHEHFQGGPEGPPARRLGQIWLFVVAITLHNFPEGMAVGVGFGGGLASGSALGLAIFLQNLPEGFLVALGLASVGYRRGRAVLVSCLTGLVETVGGLLGAAAVALAAAVLPWAMGLAAGAMLFVISHEIVPETHRNGYEVEATFGLVGGFALMLLMHAALG
jgi:ZIP family zinc transporter